MADFTFPCALPRLAETMTTGEIGCPVCSWASQYNLVHDMRTMLADDRFCDMVFLCGPAADAVPASRMLVAARSPVFKSMLLNPNMTESKLPHLPLPAIESPILRICLEFFYTDTVRPGSYHGPMSFMKVISASRFFRVNGLEDRAIKQARALIKGVDASFGDPLETVKAVTDGVSLLDIDQPNHGLFSLLMDLINFNHTKWDLDCHIHLSEGALSFLVKHMFREPPLAPFSVTQEYDRLYHVIMWCSAQIVMRSNDPAREENVATLTRFLPRHLKDICRHLSDQTATAPPDDIKLMNASTSRFLGLLSEEISTLLMKGSIEIHVDEIPLTVLYNIIEPLDILPHSMLMAAYRSQAGQAVTTGSLRWETLRRQYNRPSYVVNRRCTDPTVIRSISDTLQGIATCRHGLDVFRFVQLDWEIVILVPCAELRIGFCRGNHYRDPKISYKQDLLGNVQESWALCSKGDLYSNPKGNYVVTVHSYCSAFQIREGLRVGVHYNPACCRFSIDGKDLGIAWKWERCRRSSRMVIPAISMQSPGQARIDMHFATWATGLEKVMTDTNT